MAFLLSDEDWRSAWWKFLSRLGEAEERKGFFDSCSLALALRSE